MLILISCAKLMREEGGGLPLLDELSSNFSEPMFMKEAQLIASALRRFSVPQFKEVLKVNDAIAEESYNRYQSFGSGEGAMLPAIFAYNGVVFKNVDPSSLSVDSLVYAQSHLLITSFLYGISRPLDIIEPYRLEGKVVSGVEEGSDMFSFWKSRLTDTLISSVKNAGGVLCNLASNEMKNLFDWKRVCREVEVITPQFYTLKDGKLKTIVVYAKIGRGLMSRYIIENKIEDVSQILNFYLGGFTHLEDYKFVFDD